MPHDDSEASQPTSILAHGASTADTPVQTHPTASRRGSIRESAIPFISSFSQVVQHPTSPAKRRPDLKLDLSVSRAETFVLDHPGAHPRAPEPQASSQGDRDTLSGNPAGPDSWRATRFTPLPFHLPTDQSRPTGDDEESFTRPPRQFVRRASTPFPRLDEAEWLTASDIENLQDTDHEGEGCKTG